MDVLKYIQSLCFLQQWWRPVRHQSVIFVVFKKKKKCLFSHTFYVWIKSAAGLVSFFSTTQLNALTDFCSCGEN